MDPITQAFIQGAAGAAGGGTYVDEVFNTKAYIGNATERTITTGIDIAGEGGLIWFKNRDNSNENHRLFDSTEPPQTSSPWYSYPMFSNTTAAKSASANNVKSYNSDGFTIMTDSSVNGSGVDQVAWSFRKAPGFFDVVTYTGTGSKRTVSHNLGCQPGMIIIKRTDAGGDNWDVWHRSLGSSDGSDNKYVQLNTTNPATGSSRFGIYGTDDPTSTTFTVKDQSGVNASGATYVAYLFAGGESPAATARSIQLDGSNDGLKTSSSSDYAFGTGDFTVEFWLKVDNLGNVLQTVDHRDPSGSTSGHWVNYIDSNGVYKFWMDADRIVGQKIAAGTWNHIATVRQSGVTTLYINGTSQGEWGDTTNYTNQRIIFGLHGPNETSFPVDGNFSNIRIVTGTAVYTSSFNPPTGPLENITNTKFLAANNASVTGTTVGTAVAVDSPTASTDSPFDDPEGFKFGEEGDQNIVKCGSYIGDAQTPGPRINLGWEPQWVLVKRYDAGGTHWLMLDSVREWSTEGVSDAYLYANNSDAESHHQWGMPYSRGMQMDGSDGTTNTSEGKYIYIAIRAADGLAGKLPEAGTEVFAMDVGSSSSVIPNFDSEFPVESALMKKTSGSSAWDIVARSISQHYMQTTSNANRQYYNKYTFDSSYGWSKDNGLGSSFQSWMWKRNAGMEVVTYRGDSSSAKAHSLGKVPEMMWVKASTGQYSSQQQWKVYHKGLNGGTNPEVYYMHLNGSGAEQSTSGIHSWNNTAPSASHFFVASGNSDAETNYAGASPALEYIAFLFASVDGISKVGSYTGSSSALTITTGFQPRFVIIKNRTNSAGNWTTGWFVFDTRRGWAAGNNDKRMRLNDTAQQSTEDWTNPISTGFTLNDAGSNVLNNNGEGYIYYAHA